MNNKLSVSFVLTALLVIWLTSGAPNARAEWELLCGTDDMGYINALETDGTRLYAGTDTGVYISLDDGHTWRLTAAREDIASFAISVDAVYAAGWDYGVTRSDDHGETWRTTNKGLQVTNTETIRTGEIRIPQFHQILAISSCAVIAVAYHDGTYISHDRGETWNHPSEEWAFEGPYASTYISWQTWSMIEFDGYLWAACWAALHPLFRTPGAGGTWEQLPNWGDHQPFRTLSDYGQLHDWVVLDDQLYVAGEEGFGRWNESHLGFEHLRRGLPPVERYGAQDRSIQTLAVNRGRIFAGLRERGVYMFDGRVNIWFPVCPESLEGLNIYTLVSHKSDLYAVASMSVRPRTSLGIYRGSFPIVQPNGKLVTSWGTLKTKK